MTYNLNSVGNTTKLIQSSVKFKKCWTDNLFHKKWHCSCKV